MKSERDLESENRELTESIFTAYEAIESAIGMTDFHEEIGTADPHTKIFEESGARLKELFPFQILAFFLVDEESGALELSYCRPARERARIEELIAEETASGNLHIALRDQRPMLRPTPADREERLFLHSICTPRRCRGLFAGLYRRGEQQSDRLSQLLVSLVLSHCAKALESVDLYSLFERANRLASQAADVQQERAVRADREILKLIEVLSALSDADEADAGALFTKRLDVLYRLYAAADMTGRAIPLKSILDSALPKQRERIKLTPASGLPPIDMERAMGVSLLLNELTDETSSPGEVRLEQTREELLIGSRPSPDVAKSRILGRLIEEELSGRLDEGPEELQIRIPLLDEPIL